MAAALILTAVVLFIYYIYYKITSTHTYWKKKGVNGPKPLPLSGNMKDVVLGKHSAITIADKIYHEYPTEKVVGLYQGLTPTLLIRDPNLMTKILIKDFDHFTNRGIKISDEPITRNLFAADGDEWKTLRQKLTPIFTTGKLKAMMPLLNACVDKYIDYLNKLVDGQPRDIRKLNMKYTMKSITSVAFGLDINTYVDNTTDFERMANKIFQTGVVRKLAFFLNNLLPGVVDLLHIQPQSQVANFFMKLVKEVIHQREGKPKIRKDFMDLMIEMKEQGTVTRVKDDGVVELEITDELITAQAIVFYAAGFETSSGAMSFLLYELALNTELQDRCQQEVDAVMKKYNNTLDYDALKELQYLSMAMNESLRKYPVAAVLFRQAVTDYTFEDLNLTIAEGTKIWMPVVSVHNDPKYYPDPDKFDPERFAPENKEDHHGYYMPFGDGPRNCIGLRFARVQSLLGTAHFLYNFRVTPCEKTPKRIRMDPRQLTLSSADSLMLNIEKRKH